MKTRILALLDGSLYSASVCEHAAWAAGRLNAAVTLLHVLGRRETAGNADLSGSLPLGARTALLTELAELDAQRAKLTTQRGRAILEDGRAIVGKTAPCPVEEKLRHGDLLETVEELAPEADLLVLGKRGEAADFAKGHLGSNLERIARSSTLPVLVAARAFTPIRRALIAYDGGEAANRIVHLAAGSPLFDDMDIALVTVGDATGEQEARLEQAGAVLRAAGRAVSTRILSGLAEERLARLVTEEEINLVAMGAYGHTRLRHLFIGSTTTEMIRSCRVPILLMR